MPPPQCPECGRFLATAFVEQITTEPSPCPGCGTELSLAPGDAGDHAEAPEASPPVPPPAATRPAEEAAGVGEALEDATDEDAEDATDENAEDDDAAEDENAEDDDAAEDGDVGGDDDAAEAGAPADGAPVPADVEPEPQTSVRPPDRTPDRDPLEGWDRSGTLPTPADEPDPVVLAAGAGIGLLLGLILGGREHRGLGALLGAALGAVLSRLRG